MHINKPPRSSQLHHIEIHNQMPFPSFPAFPSFHWVSVKPELPFASQYVWQFAVQYVAKLS